MLSSFWKGFQNVGLDLKRFGLKVEVWDMEIKKEKNKKEIEKEEKTFTSSPKQPNDKFQTHH